MDTIAITTIETHMCGEPFRILTSGLPKRIPGKSLLEKRNYLQNNYDFIRNTLMREPRGHYDMFGGYLLDPVDEKIDADASVIFVNPDGYTDQCGHGIIALVTTLIQQGWVDKFKYTLKPNLMKIVLETTVGAIETHACWNGSKVEYVEFKNTPVYILYKEVQVQTSIGLLTGDIVFNGAFNFFTEVAENILRIESQNAMKLMSLGAEVKKKIQSMKSLDIRSKDFPQIKGLHGVDFINVYNKENISDNVSPNQKSCLVLGVKQIDRSPCGSGTAGRTGLLYLKNRFNGKSWFINESIIGSSLKSRVVETGIKANGGDYDACVVAIQGTANLLGSSNWNIDLNDKIGTYGFIIPH